MILIFFGLFFSRFEKNGFKSVVISLTVVQDMGVCEQAVFTYVYSGMNLDENDIVFTVKKMVELIIKEYYPLIFEENTYSRGRPKEYELDELLGFCCLWCF